MITKRIESILQEKDLDAETAVVLLRGIREYNLSPYFNALNISKSQKTQVAKKLINLGLFDIQMNWPNEGAFCGSTERKNENHYAYISYGLKPFVRLIKYFYPNKFIDVGCGLGDKVISASLIRNGVSDGIEYYEDDAIRARENVKAVFGPKNKNKIFHGDAIKFQNYGDYDFIYMYRPMKSVRSMVKLWKTILSQMKIHAKAIDVLDYSCNIPLLAAKNLGIKVDTSRYHQYGYPIIYRGENGIVIESCILRH